MAQKDLSKFHIRNPKFLLLYSPLQFSQGEVAKPDGSLSLAYLAGALRREGFEVKILDCSVGDEQSSLRNPFFRSERLENGFYRVGLSPEEILTRVSNYEVVGITSNFTPQTTQVLELIRQIHSAFPDKLIIAGGVNARNLRSRFFISGADIIALSEAEKMIVSLAKSIHMGDDITEIEGIAFKDRSGSEVINPMIEISLDLDTLPIPAWDLLPLEKYWDISRPHGGQFLQGERIQYASMQTSRGCPFSCLYCHNSTEGKGSPSGNIGRYRVKSISRIAEELERLKGIGADYVFIEDDSMFSNKQRAFQILSLVKKSGLQMLDVNGINICHFYKRHNKEYEIDLKLIDSLSEANLKSITMPFESSSQRIINKYSTSKWNRNYLDTEKLFRALDAKKIKASGNYMIGFPDETMEEIYNTLLMAKHHIELGLDYALFFTVVPFPGSVLFNYTIENKYLDPDFNTDDMRWTKSIMKNSTVDSNTIEHISQLAWLLLNTPEYVQYKREMLMNSIHQPSNKLL